MLSLVKSLELKYAAERSGIDQTFASKLSPNIFPLPEEALQMVFCDKPRACIIEFYLPSRDTNRLVVATLLGGNGELHSCDLLEVVTPDILRIREQTIAARSTKVPLKDRNAATIRLIQLLTDHLGPVFRRVIEYPHLVIVPHRHLHLCPFSGIEVQNNKHLIDVFSSITTVPSLDILTDSWLDRQLLPPGRPSSSALVDCAHTSLGLASPLYMANWNTRVFLDPTADQVNDRLEHTNMVFCYCHGRQGSQRFEDNSIAFGSYHLDFKEIVTRLTLRQMLLVALCSCDAGTNQNIWEAEDEYFGIDGAFLSAGALNTVSSSFPVVELAGSALFARFYVSSELTRKGNVAGALQDAQRWLRDGRWRQELPGLLLMPRGATRNLAAGLFLKKKVVEFAVTSEQVDLTQPIHWAYWKCTGSGSFAGRTWSSVFASVRTPPEDAV